MTRIHFHKDFYNLIKTGQKVQTARLYEPLYPLGIAVADFSDERSLSINIVKVTTKLFDELTLDEVLKDGFESKDELFKVLKGFYPNIKNNDEVMLVEFLCLGDVL